MRGYVREGRRILLISPNIILQNPNQPRRTFDRSELLSLADSIRENGMLQPITVRKRDDDRYELIAGERRLRAARIAGMREVPCILIAATDYNSAILALLENMQREDLNCFEEAEGIKKLMDDWNVTQQEAARRLGYAQSTVANKLRLLKLSDYVRERIVIHGLSERHARALLKLPTEGDIDMALDKIINENMSISEAEHFTEKLMEVKEPKKKGTVKANCDIRLFFNTINRAVRTMQLSGVKAVTKREEADDWTIYTIRIPH